MKATNSSTENTLAEIIDQLTPCTGRFPRQAVEAAIAHREAITPHLLQALEEVANAPAEFAVRKDYMLHVFAVHLLAQFREQRAYAPLVRIVAVPGEIPFDLFGDTITERLHNILGSVYDGDPAPLQRLIESDQVNEFVRGEAVSAFVVLNRCGRISREEVSRYFATLLRDRLTREFNQVWNELACAVTDLFAPELLDDLRRACEEGLVDGGYAEIDRIAHAAGLSAHQRAEWREEKYALMGDAVSEMEWWTAFDPVQAARRAKSPQVSEPRPVPPKEATLAPQRPPSALLNPPARRAPKVGRNDPCPCGSGKKFKTCCLGRV